MFVLVNPEAGGGKALDRWRSIEADVQRRIGPFRCTVAAGPLVLERCIARELARGETDFIAAGGDGTVNAVISALVEHAEADALPRIRFGAVGLGSSNDFHKPFSEERTIGGYPVRVDFMHAIVSDICTIDYVSHLNRRVRCEWLINASVGMTAEANEFFNSPNRMLGALKRRLPTTGMVYAALRSILRYRPQPMEVTVDQARSVTTSARNLGVVKNPNFSGSLCYGTPHEQTGGRFYVHLIEETGLGRLVWLLWRLLRGKFDGPGTRTWKARRVRVRAERPFVVERDGEVIHTTDAIFGLLPEAIHVCS